MNVSSHCEIQGELTASVEDFISLEESQVIVRARGRGNCQDIVYYRGVSLK